MTFAAAVSPTPPAAAATFPDDGQQDPEQPDANSHDADAHDADRRGADRHDADRHDAELEAKLEVARKKLERAAHEVAVISTQLSRPVLERFMVSDGEGSRHAIIGVQLDTQGRDGARVQDVSPGGPAAEAGLRAATSSSRSMARM